MSEQIDLIQGCSAADARFSKCGTWRYWLMREWEPDNYKGKVIFIMCNPSTADHRVNDPTVAKCVRYAKDWGFGGLFVLNIFALKSTDPKLLYTHENPVGDENDEHIRETIELNALRDLPGSLRVICAWGTHGALKNRGKQVKNMLDEMGIRAHALKLTKDGHPQHPLYIPKDQQPFWWSVPFTDLAGEA